MLDGDMEKLTVQSKLLRAATTEVKVLYLFIRMLAKIKLLELEPWIFGVVGDHCTTFATATDRASNRSTTKD